MVYRAASHDGNKRGDQVIFSLLPILDPWQIETEGKLLDEDGRDSYLPPLLKTALTAWLSN